jgi:hypothetical protein
MGFQSCALPCEDPAWDIPTQCGRKAGELNADGSAAVPACGFKDLPNNCCSQYEVCAMLAAADWGARAFLSWLLCWWPACLPADLA